MILSALVLNNNLSEFSITWLPANEVMDSGGVVNAGNEVIGEIKGIVCFDVN